MRFVRALVLIVIVVGVGIYLYRFYSPQDVPIQETPPVADLNEKVNQISIEERQIIDEAELYSVEVTYPVTGIADLDNEIKDQLDKQIVELKEVAEESKEYIEDWENQYLLIVSTGSTFSDDKVVSLRMYEYTYTGGAHGLGGPVTYNYHIPSGRILDVVDVIKTKEQLDLVARKSLKKLREQMTEFDLWEDGAEADFANYQTFTLDDDSITFYFAPYQVAPYAAGTQEVDLLYSEIGLGIDSL